jgi:DNA ligase (NAD+)
MEDVRKRIEKLIEDLNRWSYEYYVLDNPMVSDSEYDEKYDELVALEKETGIVLPYSPTQRIGDRTLTQFEKYTHRAKLWSLDKGQTFEDIKDWDAKNRKVIEEYNKTHEDKLPTVSYIITKKFDGLSINLTYDENGILVTGATRGTGAVGENVTAQVKTIKTIPLKINNESVIEVHGEALMTRKAFDEYNKEAKVPLKNLRNGAAGALRNLDVKETERRRLSAFFYDVGYNEGEAFETYSEMLDFIKKMGLPMDDYVKKVTTADEIDEEMKYIQSIRVDLDYDIDGLVIAIDDMRTRDFLGYTVKHPKWAIAYKFEALETTTVVEDVEWNVGRTGRVSPTALLQPVDIGGVTVKRATLNNMDDIAKKGVKIGSKVLVRRSNDVIPEIMGTMDDEGVQNEGLKEITIPEHCPSCGSELVKIGVFYICENSLSCKPQMVKSIVHFASREAMNIEGFNEKTAEQLFEELDIKSISDLYKIRKEDLVNLERFGKKKAQNLIDAIEKSKDCSLDSFIYALGIQNVGKKTARDIVKRFKTIDNIIAAKYEDLVQIEEVGEIVANCVVEFFRNDSVINTIRELLSLGVSPKFEEKQISESIFTGKTVVVTGSLKSFTRSGIKEKLESLGAKTSESVSKKTDYLIAGEEAGSKLKKAQDIGVHIITEEEFKAMINEGEII